MRKSCWLEHRYPFNYCSRSFCKPFGSSMYKSMVTVSVGSWMPAVHFCLTYFFTVKFMLSSFSVVGAFLSPKKHSLEHHKHTNKNNWAIVAQMCFTFDCWSCVCRIKWLPSFSLNPFGRKSQRSSCTLLAFTVLCFLVFQRVKES